MKENQGNEQNPPDNCTQEIITSVWRGIFQLGKKKLASQCLNIAFPARKRPRDEKSQNLQMGSAKTSEKRHMETSYWRSSSYTRRKNHINLSRTDTQTRVHEQEAPSAQ